MDMFKVELVLPVNPELVKFRGDSFMIGGYQVVPNDLCVDCDLYEVEEVFVRKQVAMKKSPEMRSTFTIQFQIAMKQELTPDTWNQVCDSLHEILYDFCGCLKKIGE